MISQQTSVSVPHSAWYGDEWIDLDFPDGWEVDVRRMAGGTAPALTDDEIRESLQHSLDAPKIRQLAGERKRAVVLFDDMTRPTPTSRVATLVIEELLAGGMKEDQIRFVAAFGTHMTMTRADFVQKLGSNLVGRFPVYNHNCFENLIEVGATELGTEMLVNREVMSCDLKIGIGGSIPYWDPGNYGGGAKIVLPAISGIDSIHHHHFKASTIAAERNDPRVGVLAKGGRDALRVNMEDAARLVGLDVKVDIAINGRREPAKLLVGDPISIWDEARRFGNTHYVTDFGSPADVVVVNSYPQEDQPGGSLGLTVPTLLEGGDLVVLSNSPHGLALQHYLLGRWGTEYGGREWGGGASWEIESAGRIFIVSPYISRAEQLSALENSKVRWLRNWEEVLPELTARHGSTTRVNVFPYAAIQTTFMPALS